MARPKPFTDADIITLHEQVQDALEHLLEVSGRDINTNVMLSSAISEAIEALDELDDILGVLHQKIDKKKLDAWHRSSGGQESG